MQISDLKKAKLPDLPGVYFFMNKKRILYIGKATSLKDRVRSYFSNDLIKSRGMLLVDMIAQADSVRFQKTDSVLEAFMLENELIKKHQPRYNTKEKDDKSFNYVVITKEDFPRVLVMRGRNIEMENMRKNITGSKSSKKSDASNASNEYSEIFGPYPFGTELCEALKLVRKIFPYRDTCTPLTKSPKGALRGKPCFNATIGLCPGVCSGEMSKHEYAERIKNIKLFFKGKKKIIQKDLEKKMHALAKEHKFEEANEIKKTIYALNHINDISMIKTVGFNRRISDNQNQPGEDKDSTKNVNKNGYKNVASIEQKTFRIEAYDIGHLSGKDMVGTMIVMESERDWRHTDAHPEADFSFNKNEYRKFNIKSLDKADDLRALREVLERRFTYKEWQMPDVIVIDGGTNQLKTARAVLDNPVISKYFNNKQTQIVSVVKDAHHKAREILIEDIRDTSSLGSELRLSKEMQKLVVHINAESHRYTISSHKIRRSISRGLGGSGKNV